MVRLRTLFTVLSIAVAGITITRSAIGNDKDFTVRKLKELSHETDVFLLRSGVEMGSRLRR